MPLETATYIDSLDPANPGGLDDASTSDDHHRVTKASLLRTFPNIAGEMVATHDALNRTADLTSSAQTQLDDLKTGKLDAAGTAVYATSAGFAQSASFAQGAASAIRADSAINATSSDRATSAGHADSASHASSANHATSANHANTASVAYLISGGAVTTGTIPAARIPNASVGGDGLVEYATTAEYRTGTTLARAIPVGTMNKPTSKAQDGYITFPGGILFQWGFEGNVAVNGLITFPTPFSAAPYSINATLQSAAVIGGEDTHGIHSADANGFRIDHSDYPGVPEFYWMAIGPAP